MRKRDVPRVEIALPGMRASGRRLGCHRRDIGDIKRLKARVEPLAPQLFGKEPEGIGGIFDKIPERPLDTLARIFLLAFDVAIVRDLALERTRSPPTGHHALKNIVVRKPHGDPGDLGLILAEVVAQPGLHDLGGQRPRDRVGGKERYHHEHRCERRPFAHAIDEEHDERTDGNDEIGRLDHEADREQHKGTGDHRELAGAGLSP